MAIGRTSGVFETKRPDYRGWIGPICTVLVIVAGVFGFIHRYGTEIHDSTTRSIKNEECIERLSSGLGQVERQLVDVSAVQRESLKRQDRLEGKIDQVLQHVRTVRGPVR